MYYKMSHGSLYCRLPISYIYMYVCKLQLLWFIGKLSPDELVSSFDNVIDIHSEYPDYSFHDL